VLNIISLVILLFVGRIYGRWGLPVALMFHPFNYVLAFLAFLLRFDVFAAVYARMSTMIIRTTINNPARNILMGLFPESYRGVVRPFLRGTVVRIGLFLGSGLILISDKLFHPKYLSLVAIPLVVGWLATVFFLKRRYSSILLDLVSRKMIDLKAMEDTDVEHLFRDKKTQAQLTQAFFEARGARALWFARLMKSLSAPDLDDHLIASMKREDDDIRIDMLELLSSQGGPTIVQALRELAEPENPNLKVAVIQAANRLEPGLSAGFNYETHIDSRHPEVKAYALIGLHQQEPDKYRATIQDWIAAEDTDLRKAGVVAAGRSGDISFADHLKEMLAAKENGSVLPDVLKGLRELGTPDLNDLALPYLSSPLETVRLAALEAIEIDSDELLNKVIALMGDVSESVYHLAMHKIETAPHDNIQLLVESLSIPDRHVRKGIFQILESLDVKDLDIFHFARSQIESGFQYLAEAERLRSFPESTERDLLIDHLNQKRLLQIDNILRVLATQDQSGEMKIIHRGIFSADSRQRANALEAVDNVMDKSLVKILMPLLEISSVVESLAVGRRQFALMDKNLEQEAVVSRLLANEDWVTVALVLSLMQADGVEPLNREIVFKLTTSKNPYIGRMAHSIVNRLTGQPAIGEGGMQIEVSISDKIIHLKGIEIFEGLSVSELAAVASITEEIDTPEGEVVIEEGSFGETMYLVIHGEVAVMKDMGGENELELARIKAGDYFGEMALFEDVERSASIRTEQASRFLVLHKQEFNEIVREYPQIALEICKVLGGRIRHLHNKIRERDYCDFCE
jgi:HEAT repeat protein